MKMFFLKNSYIFCVLFLINLNDLSAQDIHQLDKKRGFKDIKIGEEFTKYQNKFEFERTADNGYSVFRAVDSVKIGHLRIENLNLLVYNNKIHEIRLLLDFATFEQIKEILFKAYGEPNEKPCEELELEAGKRVDCFWKGNTMFLWCSAIDYGEYKKAVIGFKDFNMVEKMKKELTKKAVGDL